MTNGLTWITARETLSLVDFPGSHYHVKFAISWTCEMVHCLGANFLYSFSHVVIHFKHSESHDVSITMVYFDTKLYV